MDAMTGILILGGFIGTALLVVFLVSRIMSTYTSEMYHLLKNVNEGKAPPHVLHSTQTHDTAKEVNKPQKDSQMINEEELVKKLREVLNERMAKILDEAKGKKMRLMTLLDFARGYALGYVSEDDYNAFLVKVLNELEEFKRLWLMKFPSAKNKEELELMMNYVARAKLPITIKTKDKGIITLSHEEALIKITEYINNAISMLDGLIERAGESPAVTPLEIKLSQEVQRLQEKVKRLEERVEQMSI